MSTSIVGIDIGSYSCYVSVAKKGGIETVLNEFSDRCTYSCIAFNDKTRFSGTAGKSQLITNPKNTVYDFISFIGKKYRDNIVQMELPFTHYRLIEDVDSVSIEVRYLQKKCQFKPEQILAMLITKLKQLAETDLLLPVTQAVVNVPMSYTDAERRCILTALSIAGVECICLLNDLTAVAVLYHSTRVQTLDQTKVIVFVDIGYSNFQAALIRFDKDKVQILETAFDGCLGGREFDRVIYSYLARQFADIYSIDVMDSAKAGLRLMTECEKIKKRLSANAAEFDVNIDCLMNDKDVSAKFDRKLFQALSDHLLKRMNVIIVNMVQAYRKKYKEPISSVEIVGGTSRIPCVKQVVTDSFQMETQNTLNADEAVSRGCAIQCAMMNANCMIRRIEFLDCVPYGITLDSFTGISLIDLVKCDSERKTAMRQQSVPIVLNNQVYPLMNSVELMFNECSIIEIRYSDKNEVPNDNKIIGYIKVNHEGNYSEKQCKILLEYSINIHGLFTINALLLTRNSKSARPVQQGASTIESAASVNSSLRSDYSKKKGKTHKASPTNYDVYGPIDFQVFYEMSHNSQKLNDFRKQELEFIKVDQNETERLNVKNRLEETMYNCRDFLNNSDPSLISQNDNENLMRNITELENWLMEEGEDETKERYEECLMRLQNLIKSSKMTRNTNQNEFHVLESLKNVVKEAEQILADMPPLFNNNHNSIQADVDKLKIMVDKGKECLSRSVDTDNQDEGAASLVIDLESVVRSIRERSAEGVR